MFQNNIHPEAQGQIIMKVHSYQCFICEICEQLHIKYQSANCKLRRCAVNSEELSDRFLDYAASIIILVKSLGNSYQGKHISKQLLRSATSCGANYEEARGAESKAGFIHKLQNQLLHRR